MIEPPQDVYIPDRLWRCILESAGRILRQEASRKRIFELLLPILTEETLSDDQVLQNAVGKLIDELKKGGTYEKRGYLVNVAEQVLSCYHDLVSRSNFLLKKHLALEEGVMITRNLNFFYAENERLPRDYFELQPLPKVRNALLTLAADDGDELGQVYRLHVSGEQIELRFKFPRTPEPKGRADWAWTDEVVIHSPDILVERLAKGAEPKAPNLRLATVKGGERLCFLDFISETHTPPLLPPTGNILAYDWGVRRLVTLVILDRHGHQLTPPLFLNAGGMDGKQARLRAKTCALIEKRDKLPSSSPKRAHLQAEIDNCWRKYRARNRAIAHMASSVIVLMAVLYDCDTIVGEWLKTLKVRKKKGGRGKRARWRNWRTSTTVRQAIWSKFSTEVKRLNEETCFFIKSRGFGRNKYKAALVGIRTRTVWPRGTSHECPRCGKRGITTFSPEHKENIKWGPWFKCLHCGYNGDRDYVASLSIGRRWLKREAMDSKPVSYIGAGAALPFPSPDKKKVRSQVLTTLSGFRKAVRLKPSYPLLF